MPLSKGPFTWAYTPGNRSPAEAGEPPPGTRRRPGGRAPPGPAGALDRQCALFQASPSRHTVTSESLDRPGRDGPPRTPATPPTGVPQPSTELPAGQWERPVKLRRQLDEKHYRGGVLTPTKIN